MHDDFAFYVVWWLNNNNFLNNNIIPTRYCSRCNSYAHPAPSSGRMPHTQSLWCAENCVAHISVPNLQIRKLNFIRADKDHTVSKWQVQDLNSSLSAPVPDLFPLMLCLVAPSLQQASGSLQHFTSIILPSKVKPGFTFSKGYYWAWNETGLQSFTGFLWDQRHASSGSQAAG